MAKNKGAFLYKVMQPILKVIFKAYYNPTVINKEYIPIKGKAVIAGNHKHALDPILVDICTTRVVHTLAKKDLHDGKFGWFFRAIGTIPVDLHAEHNKSALNSAIEYLNDDHLGDYKFRSKNLKIVFGKPIDISKLSVEEANELLYKKIKKLIIDNRK